MCSTAQGNGENSAAPDHVVLRFSENPAASLYLSTFIWKCLSSFFFLLLVRLCEPKRACVFLHLSLFYMAWTVVWVAFSSKLDKIIHHLENTENIVLNYINKNLIRFWVSFYEA